MRVLMWKQIRAKKSSQSGRCMKGKEEQEEEEREGKEGGDVEINKSRTRTERWDAIRINAFVMERGVLKAVVNRGKMV